MIHRGRVGCSPAALLLCAFALPITQPRETWRLLVAVGQFSDPHLKAAELARTGDRYRVDAAGSHRALGILSRPMSWHLRDQDATREHILDQIAALGAAQRARAIPCSFTSADTAPAPTTRQQLRSALCDRSLGAVRLGLRFDVGGAAHADRRPARSGAAAQAARPRRPLGRRHLRQLLFRAKSCAHSARAISRSRFCR